MLLDHVPKRKPRPPRGLRATRMRQAPASPQGLAGARAYPYRHRSRLLGLVMAVSAGVGLAQEQLPAQERQREAAQAWEGQRERVLELLLEDTRRAFESGLEPPGAGGAMAVPPASPAPPVLRLLALYGVEPHYTVVLDVDGQVRTYRPGATLPLERPDPAREHRLLKVADRCAVLRRAGQGARTVCHAPGFAVEAATPAPSLAGPLPWLMR